MNFALEKQLIKFLCTYQPLSFCKTFIKNFLELIQSYKDVSHFWDQNSPFVLNKFFGTNHCYYFHLAIALVIVQNLNKFLQLIQTMLHFWAQSGPFAPKKFFLENYYYHSNLPISPFHCAKFKKNSSSGSRVMRMCNFWAQNGPFPQMRFFCFFYSCLSTCQKSKSDINLLVKY